MAAYQIDPITGRQVPVGGNTSNSPNGFDINSFLASPTGQAATGMVGAGLSAYGQSQQADANRKQSAAQTAAQLIQNQYQNDQSNQISRANGVLNNDPLGANQKFAQKNALLNAILPNLRNVRSQPGDTGVAAAMGGSRGGIMDALGPNGLDPAMIQSMFGPTTTMGSIAQHQKELSTLDPNAPVQDMSSMFGSAGADQTAQLQQFAQTLQSKQGADKAAYEQHLQQYIDQMAQKEQGDGFWHKFAKVAGIVGAGVATVMTAGGASPLLAAAVAAGSGAASGWGGGGGVKGALLGAAVGGATAGLGGGAASGATQAGLTAGNVAKTTLTNPALYSAILGR